MKGNGFKICLCNKKLSTFNLSVKNITGFHDQYFFLPIQNRNVVELCKKFEYFFVGTHDCEYLFPVVGTHRYKYPYYIEYRKEMKKKK